MPVDDQEPRYRLAIQDVDGDIVDRLGTLYAEADGTLKIQEGSGSFNEASLNPDGTFSVPTAPDNADEVARKEELDGKADTPHDLGGDDHSEDTLENLNSKVSDADLATDPHGNENHEPNFAEDPHDNDAHSEDFITGIDTADGPSELGEAIRYVFGENLELSDLGGGELSIDATADVEIDTIDPRNAVSNEEPDAQEDNNIAISSSFADDDTQTVARFPFDIAIGSGAQTDEAEDGDGPEGNIAIGIKAIAEGGNFGSISIGEDSLARGPQAVSIGRDASVISASQGVAVGPGSEVTENDSVAVGQGATASGTRTAAIGGTSEALNSNDGTLGTDSSFGPNNWTVPGDFTVEGSKDFEIDHPSKPSTHDLRHGAYEGPVPGGLIYSETVDVDGTETSLEGVFPDYITADDFGANWTDHVNENNGFGTGYIDTSDWTLHVEHSGEYDVTLIGERDDDAAVSKGKKRTEKPKGETWSGEPRTYWVDVGRIDTDNYDGVQRVEAKYDHTPECDPMPCEEAFESYRVTFDDGERVVVKGIEYDSTAQEIIDAARE